MVTGFLPVHDGILLWVELTQQLFFLVFGLKHSLSYLKSGLQTVF